MSNKKKFFLIFLFIVLDMFLLIGFLVIRDATSLNDLRKEIKVLDKLDMSKDRYNRSIKSSGEYKVIEKAIKTYLDDNAVLMQDVLSIVKDSKLTKILSYDNYKEDGPNFDKSLKYLESTKKDFSKKIDKLISNLDEESAKKYINGKTNDKYYKDLYLELMITDKRLDDFKKNKELLNDTKNKVNNVLDTSTELLNFLKNNKDNYVLEDNEIKFKTRDLYNQYNGYISKIQKKEG